MLDPNLTINTFRLTARLKSKEAIRYTPAGQAVVKCELHYIGSVLEAEIFRKVEMQIMAIGMGSVANTLNQLEIGQLIEASGFMAHQGLQRKALVFHITTINI